jgi:hypothetical protein
MQRAAQDFASPSHNFWIERLAGAAGYPDLANDRRRGVFTNCHHQPVDSGSGSKIGDALFGDDPHGGFDGEGTIVHRWWRDQEGAARRPMP